MDRLSYTSAQAIVVPSLDHLSRDQTLRAELRTQVTAAGAVVLVMPAPLSAVASRVRR